MKLLIKPNNDEVKEMYHDDVTYEANERRSQRGDAGFDLYFPGDILVPAQSTMIIDLKVQCEGISGSGSIVGSTSHNVCYYLHCRSSISKTPLRLANSVGIIDAGYRGNLKVAVDNSSSEDYQIQKGQRLFQITGRYLEPIDAHIVEDLSSSDRGNGGFGSTGGYAEREGRWTGRTAASSTAAIAERRSSAS